MALSISSTFSSMRLAAGEPIVFSYQPASSSGVLEDLTGRAFVLSIYDDQRNELKYLDAAIVNGDVGVSALWALDGSFSNQYPNKTANFEISERLDNGRDRIATGKITIDGSAPRVDDFNNAAISRYITHITRLNDPATIDAPIYHVVVARYLSIVSNVSFLDFSSPSNSLLLACV